MKTFIEEELSLLSVSFAFFLSIFEQFNMY